MKRLVFILIISAGLLAACNETKELEEKILAMAKEFKEVQYTIEYDQIPVALPKQVSFSQEKVRKFLTEDELERLSVNRALLQPVHEAEKRGADLEVRELKMDFIDLPDNSETNKNLEYQMTIQFIQEDTVVDEFLFDGRLRIEKINDEWKIDWDEDSFFKEVI